LRTKQPCRLGPLPILVVATFQGCEEAAGRWGSAASFLTRLDRQIWALTYLTQ
jgi:hypothetical protein